MQQQQLQNQHAKGQEQHDKDMLQLAYYVMRIETRLWNELDERLNREHSISMASFEVLHCVSITEQCRPADIRATLAVSSGGVTKLLDRLEQSGLVTRVANTHDRRSSYIEITERGQQVVEQAQATVAKTMTSILSHVFDVAQPEQLQQLLHTCWQLNKVLVTRCWDADHQE